MDAHDVDWAQSVPGGSRSVVHHLPDEVATVTALASLLRPGGRLALGEGGLPYGCCPMTSASAVRAWRHAWTSCATDIALRTPTRRSHNGRRVDPREAVDHIEVGVW
ncbi:hypothetical protein BH23ACT9_BH23ACT9_37700 [soil metagenome]